MRNRTCFAFPFTPLLVTGAFFLVAVPPLGVILLGIALVIQVSHMRSTKAARQASQDHHAQVDFDSQVQGARFFL